MVKSMTGYGRAVETVNGREFTVEVRSVNNRYLDCTVKLPRGLSFGEDAVKQAVKATISRGKVDVFVSVRSEGAQDTAVSLNKPMVEGYLAALKQLQADYGVTGEITVSMLAGLPDVFLLDKPQVDEAQLLADGAVHLDGGQTFQSFHNGLVGQLQGLVNGLALDEVGGHAAGGNGGTAAKGQELDINDHIVLDLQVHAHDIAALGVAHFTHAVCVGDLADIVRVCEMLHDLCAIHTCHLSFLPSG